MQPDRRKRYRHTGAGAGVEEVAVGVGAEEGPTNRPAPYQEHAIPPVMHQLRYLPLVLLHTRPLYPTRRSSG